MKVELYEKVARGVTCIEHISVEMQLGSDKNKWMLPLDLNPGNHEFKFVVDGHWTHDPEQSNSVNDLGSQNNVITIKVAGNLKHFHPNFKRHSTIGTYTDRVPTVTI